MLRLLLLLLIIYTKVILLLFITKCYNCCYRLRCSYRDLYGHEDRVVERCLIFKKTDKKVKLKKFKYIIYVTQECDYEIKKIKHTDKHLLYHLQEI